MSRIFIVLVVIAFYGCQIVGRNEYTLEEVNQNRIYKDTLVFERFNRDSLICLENGSVKNNIYLCITHELNVDLREFDLIVEIDHNVCYWERYQKDISLDIEVCNTNCCHELSFTLKDKKTNNYYVFTADYVPAFNDKNLKGYRIALLSDESIEDAPYHHYKLNRIG